MNEERARRRRRLLRLRGSGVTYSLSAFGYPLGSITGVVAPDPPLSDQFNGVAGTTTDSGTTSGASTGDAGGSGT